MELPQSSLFRQPAVRGALILGLLHMVIAFFTRCALLFQARHDVAWNLSLFGGFGTGLISDAIAASFVVLVWVLLCSLIPQFLWRRIGWCFTVVLFFGCAGFLLFTAVAEWFFWDEFQVRFNFIAVDYLVWTQEVWGNVRESYPMPAIITGLAVGSALLVALLIRLRAVRWVAAGQFTWENRMTGLLALTAIPVLITAALFWDDLLVWLRLEAYSVPVIILCLAVIPVAAVWLLARGRGATRPASDGRKGMVRLSGLAAIPAIIVVAAKQSQRPVFQNQYNQELAKNGMYSLFAAFWAMEIPYEKFYRTMDEHQVLAQTRALLTAPDSQPLAESDRDLRRRIHASGEEKRYNVMLICMESLSADFMGRFGNPRGLTPNLDRLAGEGLLFSRCYATGTRTVRGLEALTLSLPPTPGQAIIYRPGSTGLYTLGAIFGGRGYDCAFVYGGNGRFDYMNRFFSGNGYQALDKNAWAASDISFETSWGACDEDLFRKSIAEADVSHAAGHPFHLFCMTTSNHRPFQFPTDKFKGKGRDGRESSVMYADYAIGRLMEEAPRHPWFDNTLFLFCADHCASSAGKMDLDVTKFHIPAILWNPKLIKPQDASMLCSQIDVIPTVLALMNWQYTSLFFGQNLLAQGYGAPRRRAFVSNYQKIGLLHEDSLAILKPRKMCSLYRADPATGKLEADNSLTALASEAVAWYQSASWLWHNQLHLGDFGVSREMAR